MLSRRLLPTILILALFAGIIFVQRIRLIDAPLQGDICAYALIGHEMTNGRQLYSDLWERKPPLLYITYAAAERVAGYGPRELFLLGIMSAIASLVMIGLIGRSAGNPQLAGILTAGFWTLLNNDLQLTANQPDPEVFINVWLIAAFLLIVRWPHRRRFPAAVLLGMLLSAATLYKHNCTLACAGLLGGFLLVHRPGFFRQRFVETTIAASVIAVVWLTMLAYFQVHHHAGALIDVLFLQNASYSGSFGANLLKAFLWTHLFPASMAWALAPVLLITILMCFRLQKHQKNLHPQWLLLICWSIGTWPTIALTGYLSPHYYQLWLPIGCIAGGWAGAALLQKSNRIPPVIAIGALFVAVGFLVIRQGREMLLTPTEWIHEQFPDFNLAEQNQLGTELGKLLEPNELFWEFGDDNALYFFSKHSPPTGLLFIDPFLYGSETSMYWDRLLRDLNHANPALVVMSDNYTMLFHTDAPVLPWLQQNYFLWDTPLGWPYHHLLIRRGSDLARRLRLEQSDAN